MQKNLIRDLRDVPCIEYQPDNGRLVKRFGQVFREIHLDCRCVLRNRPADWNCIYPLIFKLDL